MLDRDLIYLVSSETSRVLKSDYDINSVDEKPCISDKFHHIFHNTTVAINIFGDVQGVVVLSASENLLRHIVYFFTWDKDMYDDEIGCDGLLEFCNIVAGHAIGNISNNFGIEIVDISTPYLFNEQAINDYDYCDMIAIETEFGSLDLYCIY